MKARRDRVIIVGAGLVGPVLGLYLARRGLSVDIYERNEDPRASSPRAGRSINLTLSTRGFEALEQIGLDAKVSRISIPLYGRRMHFADGTDAFQPYGDRNEAIHAVSRNALNRLLLDAAERDPRIRIHFGWACAKLDPSRPSIELSSSATRERRVEEASLIFAADGASSAVRSQMIRRKRVNYSQEYFDRGYKEFTLAPSEQGAFALDPHATHIWPRDEFMMIAFPNLDRTFTCTLHLPFEGRRSFASLRTAEALRALFDEEFPDLARLLPKFTDEYFSRPVNSMVTIRCNPWLFGEKVLLIGDAAHAIYPSYGQGANAGFEDCLLLDRSLDAHTDASEALRAYEAARRPSTDAIADLCIDHFVELRDHVGKGEFLLRKSIERRLAQLLPDEFSPLYSMVSFTSMPYADARRRDGLQRHWVDALARVEGIEQKLDTAEFERLVAGLRKSHR